MKLSIILINALVFLTISAGSAAANDDDHTSSTSEHKSQIPYHPDKRHHLSILTAGTNVPSEDYTAFTVGIDYEYRINRRLGVGFVAEQAFSKIDATSLLAVADIHLWRGLTLQIGPGVEFVDKGEKNETFALARIGALYELELGEGYTISPQFHYDISSGADAIVFGVAFGRAF